MINIPKQGKHILILVLAITVVASIRQSEIGVNQWSKQNIGNVVQISFPTIIGSASSASSQVKSTPSRQFKNIFYFSQLGIWGHLDKKTGAIVSRQYLAQGEHILESNDKQLTVLTSNGQIIRYNKYNMAKTIDNRFFLPSAQNAKIHSYLSFNNKIYISDSSSIKQYDNSIRKAEQISALLIQKEGHHQILKIFTNSKQDQANGRLFALVENDKQICLRKVTRDNKLVQLKCFSNGNTRLSNKSNDNKIYLKVLEKTGSVYFGNQQSHHFINLSTLKHQKLQAKPISILHEGISLLNNGIYHSGQGILQNSNQIFHIQCKTCPQGKSVFAQRNAGTNYYTIHFGKHTEINRSSKLGRIHVKQGGQEFKAKTMWANYVSDSDIELVAMFQDLQLVFYHNTNGNQFKQIWNREQSLAYVDKVLFMKYQGFADHLNNPYHMKMDDPSYKSKSFTQKLIQAPANIASRIKSQFADIYNFIMEKLQSVKHILSHPKQQFQQLLDIKGYLKSRMSQQKQKKYGLRKYIIVITKYNTIFSIDSKTTAINWKKKYGSDSKLITLIKLKQQYQKQIAIAISYKYHITYISQIHEDGTITQLEDYQTAQQPSVHKISAHSILIRSGDKVNRYDINKQLQGTEKEYNFYSVQGNNKVVGWKIVNQDLIQTWSLQLPHNQTLISTTPVYRGQPQSNIPLVNDKRVIFKNVDFANLAILTMQQYTQQTAQAAKLAHRLHVYMINGLTGTIQFSQYQTGVSPTLPINLVYDQHNVIITYYNVRNRVYQIWSIQAFQFVDEKQLLSKKYQPEYEKDNIVFRSKVYGTIIPIKHLFISQSKQALLKRNLIITTRQNKVYSLSRQLVSTRRPKSTDAQANAQSPQAEFISSKYPQQEYILPVNVLSYLSYNRKLAEINHMRFSSSDLQSTIFMMAYGIDIFLIRIAPDKAFDTLADGFNYLQLVAIMVGVTVAALFFKGKVKQAKLRKLHLD